MTRALWISLLSTLLAGLPGRAMDFVDWTSIDTGSNFATGDLQGVSVFFGGSDITGGVVDESSDLFSHPPFSPSLALSDFVSFTADEPALSYSVSFGAPVTDSVIHFGSLASTLTFNGGIALTKVSGQSEFAVSGSTVTGNILDGVTPNDANGTILLNGTFSSFSFQAEKLPAVFSGDGINLQIGAAAIPEPGLSGFGAACLVLLAALLGRSRSSFLNRF